MVLKDDYRVLLAETGKQALEIFVKHSVDLVLLDIRLPDADGLDLLVRLKDIDPDTEVIMVTAVNEVQSAVRSIKSGAYEYIIKPFVVDELLAIIDRAMEKRQLVKEVFYLRHELERYHFFEKMVGKDRKMRKIFEWINTVSQSSGAVLIQGESGTGKELVARAIHNRSPRKNNPFVVINCAAIPEALMERELFGHVKGAFTGASDARIGKLEIANKGTVFLDDIDTLDINMQAKLLRVLQEKELERLGSTRVLAVDIRFVAASNKVLCDLILEGKFREDLYYRLNVFPIKIPPLRDRKVDIPLLINHFLDRHAKNGSERPRKKFSEKAIHAMKAYHWPGNVRELQNIVERLCTISQGDLIRIEDISPGDIGNREIKDLPLKPAVGAFERQYIKGVLDYFGGNRKLAAAKLGIHRNTLLVKIKEYDLGAKGS